MPCHAVPDSPRRDTTYPHQAIPDRSWAKTSPIRPPLLQATQDCHDSRKKMPDPAPHRCVLSDLGFLLRAETPPPEALCTSEPTLRLDPDRSSLPQPSQADGRVLQSLVPSQSRARDGVRQSSSSGPVADSPPPPHRSLAPRPP